MPSEPAVLSRRRLLGLASLLATGGLAGCFSPGMGGPVSEIAISNGTEQSVEVSLDVYHLPTDERVVHDEFALDSETERNYSDPFTEDGRKRLVVVADGSRRASYEWDANADPNGSGVDVDIYEEEINVGQVAA